MFVSQKSVTEIHNFLQISKLQQPDMRRSTNIFFCLLLHLNRSVLSIINDGQTIDNTDNFFVLYF